MKYNYPPQRAPGRWAVLRGRQVAHFVSVHPVDGRVSTECGTSRGRYHSDIRDEAASTRRCQQCEMALVTGVRGSRQRRRALWRAHLGLGPIAPKHSSRKIERLRRRSITNPARLTAH